MIINATLINKFFK